MPPITHFGIPTKNRPEQLLRLVQQLVAAETPYPITITVVDRSDQSSATQSRNAIAQAVRGTDATLEYWDRHDIEQYCAEVAHASGIEKGVLYQALCPDDANITTGASRNFLLLRHAGIPHAQLDDDITLQFLSKDIPGSPVITEQFPCDIIPQPDLPAALDGMTLKTEYPLEPLQEPIRFATKQSMAAVDAGSVPPEFSPTWLQQRVVIVSPGVTGDSPVRRSFYEFVPPQPDHPLFSGGEEQYRALRQSAYATIVARSNTLTQHLFCITHCALFPTSVVLPPFPPTGRTQDKAFGYLLQRLYPAYYRLHAPYALAHLRGSELALPLPFSNDQVVESNQFLIMVMQYLLNQEQVEPTLETLGSSLIALASFSTEECARFIRDLVQAELSAAVAHLTAQLENETPLLKSWYLDRQAMLDSYRTGLSQLDKWDIPQSLVANAQDCLMNYGKILMLWNEVYQSVSPKNSRQ